MVNSFTKAEPPQTRGAAISWHALPRQRHLAAMPRHAIRTRAERCTLHRVRLTPQEPSRHSRQTKAKSPGHVGDSIHQETEYR
jgi:hypothetical protein